MALGKTTLLRYLAGMDPTIENLGQASLVGQAPSGEVFDIRNAGARVHYFRAGRSYRTNDCTNVHEPVG